MERMDSNNNTPNDNAEKWEVQPEDFPMPKLPETESHTITPFREIFQYVDDLETVVSSTKFTVHLPIAPDYSLTYVCSFKNPEQANNYFRFKEINNYFL